MKNRCASWSVCRGWLIREAKGIPPPNFLVGPSADARLVQLQAEGSATAVTRGGGSGAAQEPADRSGSVDLP